MSSPCVLFSSFVSVSSFLSASVLQTHRLHQLSSMLHWREAERPTSISGAYPHLEEAR